MVLLEKLQEFWEAYGSWITVALIPTIITGLSLTPGTKKYAGMVGTVWEKIKPLLSRLSVATYKDQPGTFKAPLTPGVPKKEGEAPPPPPPTAGCAALIFILALGSMWTQPGCAWFSSSANKAKEVVIDCTVEAVKTSAASLLPVIVAILTGNSPEWKKMLEGITTEMGRDAVACALNNAAIELQAKIPAEGPGDNPEATKAVQGTQKARGYISEKDWQFKENM